MVIDKKLSRWAGYCAIIYPRVRLIRDFNKSVLKGDNQTAQMQNALVLEDSAIREWSTVDPGPRRYFDANGWCVPVGRKNKNTYVFTDVQIHDSSPAVIHG